MYDKIYVNLCNKGKLLKDSYDKRSNLHKHHILPKHLNGTDDDYNITYLTIREHVIAHFLLWKIHKNPNDLRSMNMLGANLTYIQRQIVGKWCHDNNIGFFNKKWSNEKNNWIRKGIKTQINKKIGIHNPDNFKKYSSLGGKAGSKSQIEKGIAIFNKEKRSEYASLGGKSLSGMICVTNGKHRTRIRPEKLDEYLSKGYIKGFTLFS